MLKRLFVSSLHHVRFLKLVSVSIWKGFRRDDSFDSEMARMASDPEIQREIAAINAEFAVADADGLIPLLSGRNDLDLIS
jgi:hypothetical protein